MVRSVDPEVALSDVQPMDARVAASLLPHRSPALLAGLFACVAVLLTAIGTYGLLSYAVAQRRREIDVRLALGARPSQVCGQFVALALRLMAAGLALGVLGALLSGRAMRALLFQVPAVHPETLATTAGLMGAISLAACLVPAYRAARTPPMQALADD